MQKLFFFRQWRGYKSDGLKLRNQEPYFQAKSTEIFQGNLSCRITVRSSEAPDQRCHYKLESLAGKLAFKITNSNGEIVAEVSFWFFQNITDDLGPGYILYSSVSLYLMSWEILTFSLCAWAGQEKAIILGSIIRRWCTDLGGAASCWPLFYHRTCYCVRFDAS